MQFPKRYKTELVNALESIDLNAVENAVKIFREASAHGRCIFVCGDDGSAMGASRLLCDTLRSSNVNRTMKFRIFALSDEVRRMSDGIVPDYDFVNQLRNIANTGDVVVGISASGNSKSVIQALEYGNEVGCRTVCISGWAGGKLATVSEIAILVLASHPGNVEDAHMMICRMIGHFFLDWDQD